MRATNRLSAAPGPALAPVSALPDSGSPALLDEQLRLERGRGGDRARLLRRMFALQDVLSAGVAGLVAAAVGGAEPVTALIFVGVAVVLWVGLLFAAGLYVVDALSSWATGVVDIGRLTVMAIMFSWPLLGVGHLLGFSHPDAAALVSAPVALGLAATGRGAIRGLLHRVAPLRQRTLIVGSGVVAGKINERLRRHPEYGLEPIGLVDDDPHTDVALDVPTLGELRDLRTVLSTHGVDRVIIAFSRASHHELLECLRACRENRVAVDVVPRLFEFVQGAQALEQIGDVPVLSIGVPRLSRSSRAAKRALDIGFALAALLTFLPLLVVIAIAIKLESRGPVLFRQLRIGQNGKEFEILKFRSMYRDADARKAEFNELNNHSDGVMFKIHRDPRISRVGRILRRLSLDEVPQFINVLKGDMSVVGPRPLILPEHDAMAERWHSRRLDLPPGLTGPWQISGRSDLDVHDMARLDFQYVTGWSLARDIEIILATVPAVFAGRGAY
ncbi:MAG TPA: sugar transferase [Capillimicrobium sp.]